MALGRGIIGLKGEVKATLDGSMLFWPLYNSSISIERGKIIDPLVAEQIAF